MSGAAWSDHELQIVEITRHASLGDAIAALRTAGFRRSMMSVRLKRNRLWPEMGVIWPRAQFDYLMGHWRDGDAAVARALAELGPARTIDAVKSKRHKAGLYHHEQHPKGAGVATWPEVASCPIEQDRNYMRALLSDIRRTKQSTERPTGSYPVDDLTPPERAYTVSMNSEARG